MNDPTRKKPVISLAVTDQGAVCVRLAGDIDIAVEASLTSLSDVLAAAKCSILYIDLHDLRFADSSLLDFVARLAGQLPGYALVTLCRPSSMTLQMFELVGLHTTIHIRHDLPAEWISAADAACALKHSGAGRDRAMA